MVVASIQKPRTTETGMIAANFHKLTQIKKKDGRWMEFAPPTNVMQ